MPSHNINVQIIITRVVNGVTADTLADQGTAAPEPVNAEELSILIDDCKALAAEEYAGNVA